MTEAEVNKAADGGSSASTTPKDAQGDPLLNKESGDAASSKQRVEVDKSDTAVVGDKDEGSKNSDDKDKDVKVQDEAEKQDEKPMDDSRRRPYRRYRMGGRYGGGRFRISPEEEQHRWEDQQKKKPVIQQGVTGKVKWYSFRKNYGFIQRDDDDRDVFVHQLAITKSRIRKPNLRTLGYGETVQFDVVQGKKGLEASNVTGPNDTEVQGSRIIFIFADNYDRFNRPRLPYYNDYSRRPAYYDNYRRQALRDRDFRPHDDRIGIRYEDSRPRYPANRDRFYPDNHDRSYPGNRDRPYPRNHDGYYHNKHDRSYPVNRRYRYRNEKTEHRDGKSERRDDKPDHRDDRPERRDDKSERRNNKSERRDDKSERHDDKSDCCDEKPERQSVTMNKNDNKKMNGSRRPRFGRPLARKFYNKKNQHENNTSAQSETSVKKTSAASDEDVKDKQQDIPEDLIKGVATIKV